ncbi:hypothetical protein H6P81_005001 [Aristolochia fimbriata]|uniref:SHSP domain-containing protein n=1 Tax=Aristolochia fimbriata TaxID=158543 RepID=A0AAV7EWS9_ARIFI|nr:hypothetical protein H6P81_005001 [Aristolochia fimbriata]
MGAAESKGTIKAADESNTAAAAGGRADSNITYVVKPRSELVEENRANTLMIYLPGFEKEQLRVQYDEQRSRVEIRGERPGVIRIREEFPVPRLSDDDQIRATFKEGVLKVKIPRRRDQGEDQNASRIKKPSKLMVYVVGSFLVGVTTGACVTYKLLKSEPYKGEE